MEKVKPVLRKMLTWIKRNWILILILFLGAFLRLYKIDQYMTFLGDEGRDAIIVRRLIVFFDPILVGPGTSIGQMYLGPLYYYLIAPSLLLANFSPVGPSAFVAVLGVATIYLTWVVAKEWFGEMAAGAASLLYAISPTVIIYSRSSWNPNVMPFFAILCIYAIWRVWKDKEYLWLLIMGTSFAFVLQSHYLGLLLAPALFIFWFLAMKDSGKDKAFVKYSIFGIIAFLFLMSPLVIFDARHGWNNFSAMKKFFTIRQETVSIRPWNAIPKTIPLFEKINERLLSGNNKSAGKYVSWAVIAFSFLVYVKRNKILDSGKRKAYLVLFAWLAFALIGLGLYKQEIYDHYFGFFFPAPFMLFGGLVSSLYSQAGRAGKGVLILVFIVLAYFSFKASPLKSAPNMQLARSMQAAEKIGQEANGIPFNLAVIAERNYEDGYQYFLEKNNQPIVEIDAQVEKSVTDQLFVVCEMEKAKCDPTHSAKAEVANFGWSKIEGEWEVMGVRIYKLVHSEN